MKRTIGIISAALVIIATAGLVVWRDRPAIQRVGIVIGVRPDKLSAYEALHAASNKGVRNLLEKYHIRNFTIFIRRLDDGRYYEFGYYEYTGRDYQADMQRLANEPRNRAWLSLTDPMQIPLSGESSWAPMQEIYHNP